MVNPNWEFSNVHDLLVACVGNNFGDNPEEHLPEIRASRALLGKRLVSLMEIQKHHIVLDIGSGGGFVTRPVVEKARHVHCVDISKDFLAYCKEELAEFDNVTFHVVEYAAFPDIMDSEVDRVYSTAVFIHFNFYDYVLYFLEISRKSLCF